MRSMLVLAILTLALGACTGLIALDDGDGAGAEAGTPDAGCAACSPAPDAPYAPDSATPDSSAPDAVAEASGAQPEGGADGGDAASGPPGPAQYNGGRVLLDPSTLVAVYWGNWPSNTEADCENLLEPSDVVTLTSFFQPITQYLWQDGGALDSSAPLAPPSLQFQAPRHFYEPGDGGVTDPDLFVESIAAATAGADPDTIYVVFFTTGDPLCGTSDGCSGLTPNLHVPYIRVEYDGDVVSSSRVMFSELVDVITDSDGMGWSVPYGGQSYPLGRICSLSAGGGGLGSEATLRVWDEGSIPSVYATDGIFSALSDHGRCVNSLATLGVVAAVGNDGSTSAYLAPSAVPSSAGYPVSLLPPTSDVSISASRTGIAWHGVWTMDADGGGEFTQAWPVTNDPSSEWESYPGGGILPAYVSWSSMDSAMEGDARWDAFVVGFTAGGDASPGTSLLFHASYDSSQPCSREAWQAFDMVGVPGNPQIVSGPGATSYAPGRIDAFVLGASAAGTHLLQTWCDERQNGVYVAGRDCNTPMGWVDLGAPPDGVLLIGDPDAASWPSGTTDSGHFAVACTAADGSVRTLRYDDGVTAWGILSPPPGVTFLKDPSITGMGDGRYWTTALGSDGAVWTRLDDWSTPGAWTKSSLPQGALGLDITSY